MIYTPLADSSREIDAKQLAGVKCEQVKVFYWQKT